MNRIDQTQVTRRESRARGVARKLGFLIRKNRSRDVSALTFGGYMIVDENNCAVAGVSPVPYFLDLDEVEDELQAWLT